MLDPALLEERQRSGRVLGRVSRVRLEDELDVARAAPGVAHLLGLRRPTAGPIAREEHGSGVVLGG